MILKLNEITLDKACQPRLSLDKETVNEYITRMQEGDKFPPVIVFDDGKRKWLADGFHRYEASKLTGFMDIKADVRKGTKRDAVLYSVQANARHGKRRTNADKRKAVMILLEDWEWAQWSDRNIAKQCFVSNKFVSNLRKEVVNAGYVTGDDPVTPPSVNGTQITSDNSQETQPKQTERKVIRNGVEYTQDISNIGRASRPPEPVDEPEDEDLDEQAKVFFNKPPMPLPEKEESTAESEELEEEAFDDEFEDDPILTEPLVKVPQRTEEQKLEAKIRDFKNLSYKFGSAMFDYFSLLKEIEEKGGFNERMTEDVNQINDYFLLIYAALKRAKGGEDVA